MSLWSLLRKLSIDSNANDSNVMSLAALLAWSARSVSIVSFSISSYRSLGSWIANVQSMLTHPFYTISSLRTSLDERVLRQSSVLARRVSSSSPKLAMRGWINGLNDSVFVVKNFVMLLITIAHSFLTGSCWSLSPFAIWVITPSFIIASWMPTKSLSASIFEIIVAAANRVGGGTSKPFAETCP